MKRNSIVMFFIVAVLVMPTTLLINNTKKAYIMQDGMLLALTLDGNPITSFPEKGEYHIQIDCGDTAEGKWLVEDWKLAVEEINGNVACNIDFTTGGKKFKSVVEEQTSKVMYDNVDYSSAVSLSENEYSDLSVFYGGGYGSTSGTDATGVFVFNSGVWNSLSANMISNKYYHFKFNIPDDGYYQLCYTMSSGSTSNRLYLYKNTTSVSIGGSSYLSASSSSSKSGCVELGKLATDDYIKVTQRPYTTIATISFYLQKSENIETINTGYRYTGKSPNNWVYFNNEKWRIIGSIPTCTSSSCNTQENLVKIIRAYPISGYGYDSSGSNGAWGSNSLYNLLNTYYFSKKDGTQSGYCYGHSTSAISNCDYREIGIDSTDFYGKMVKMVYWNTGQSVEDVTSSAAYTNETKKQTVSGYIGLLSTSDYGFAVDSQYYNTILENYTTDAIIGTNWLHGFANERTNIQNSNSTSNALTIYMDGGIGSNSSSYGYNVRPVVYLDSLVYIVSGDGTEGNPYQIAM